MKNLPERTRIFVGGSDVYAKDVIESVERLKKLKSGLQLDIGKKRWSHSSFLPIGEEAKQAAKQVEDCMIMTFAT